MTFSKDQKHPLSIFYELLVVHGGIQPSEFWQMSPKEVMFYIRAKQGEPEQSGLSDDQFAHLEKRRIELESQGVNVA